MARADSASIAAVPLERKIAFLRKRDAYAEQPQQVTAIQTHMSWVFLTGRHAYKLKKPVRFDFLDFRTIEARKHDCEQELRLNRRLAEHVYLDVVPLTVGPDGSLQLNGAGEPVDWLVRMRQLPTERFLDVMVRRRSVTPREVQPVFEKLAQFYHDAPPAEDDPTAFCNRLKQQIRDVRAILLEHDHRRPRPTVEKVADGLLHRLEELRELFAARVDAGHIIEGHGDLRPEHICLVHPPVIIDCIEFNRLFRIVDPADELSFLAMECSRLHGEWVGEVAFDIYESITGDDGARKLSGFFMASRAFLRSRLAFGHLLDGDMPDHEQVMWQARTAEYLARAEQALHMDE